MVLEDWGGNPGDLGLEHSVRLIEFEGVGGTLLLIEQKHMALIIMIIMILIITEHEAQPLGKVPCLEFTPRNSTVSMDELTSSLSKPFSAALV